MTSVSAPVDSLSDETAAPEFSKLRKKYSNLTELRSDLEKMGMPTFENNGFSFSNELGSFSMNQGEVYLIPSGKEKSDIVGFTQKQFDLLVNK